MNHEKNSLVSGRSRPDPRGSSGNLSSERASSSVPNSVGELREVAKHTPGPWESNGYRVCAVQREIHGGVLFSVYICDTANNKATRTPENEANARLIAAAPELLAVARAASVNISSMLAMNDVRKNISGASLSMLEHVERQLDAAIAKAEPKRVEDGGAR